MVPSFDDIKKIAKVLQEAGKIDLYEKLLEMKRRAMEMQEKIEALSSENKKLKKNQDIEEDLEVKDNHYWWKKGGNLDGPFCTKCWDKEKLLIRVPVYEDNEYQFECPNCQTKIRNKKYVNPPARNYHDQSDFMID
jgi:hypothetical protein